MPISQIVAKIAQPLDAALKRRAKCDRMGWSDASYLAPHSLNRCKHMPYILIRHKVADFSKWKPAYDAHSTARQEAGLREVHLLRNSDDPNEVVILLEAEDLQRGRDFAASPGLRERMQEAGVTDRPDIYFLE